MYYIRKPAITTELVADETLLLDVDRGQVHQLNPTASLIWQLCDGVNTFDDMARRLTQEYDVEMDVAIRDVQAVLGQLLELELLDERAGGMS